MFKVGTKVVVIAGSNAGKEAVVEGVYPCCNGNRPTTYRYKLEGIPQLYTAAHITPLASVDVVDYPGEAIEWLQPVAA